MSYYVGKINNNEFLILKDQNKIKFSFENLKVGESSAKINVFTE